MARTITHLNSNSKVYFPKNVAYVGCMCWERQGKWGGGGLFCTFDLRKEMWAILLNVYFLIIPILWIYLH